MTGWNHEVVDSYGELGKLFRVTNDEDDRVLLICAHDESQLPALIEFTLNPSPEPPALVPDRVTARQFKLQLLAAGLIDQVEAWIATQPRAVQIAYEYSGTFVRDEPMMQAGFSALGFTEQEVSDFFTAAAAL